MKRIFTSLTIIGIITIWAVGCSREPTGPKNTLNIQFIVNPLGYGSISTPSLDYIKGDTITVKAVPEPGYKFKSWSGDILSSNGKTAKVLVNKAKKIVANFAKKSYKLTLNIHGNGSVKIFNVDSVYTVKKNVMQQYMHDFPFGTKLKLTATPSVNYKFSQWVGVSDSLAKSNPLTYTTGSSNHSISAVFKLKSGAVPTAVKPQGKGIINNPYRISSLGNLIWLSENSSQWDKYYIQTQDIDATATLSAQFNGGKGFSPIGINDKNWFNGSYDGQGHSIKNLYIHRPSIKKRVSLVISVNLQKLSMFT